MEVVKVILRAVSQYWCAVWCLVSNCFRTLNICSKNTSDLFNRNTLHIFNHKSYTTLAKNDGSVAVWCDCSVLVQKLLRRVEHQNWQNLSRNLPYHTLVYYMACVAVHCNGPDKTSYFAALCNWMSGTLCLHLKLNYWLSKSRDSCE